MTSSTITDVTSYFVVPELTPITVTPTRATLQIMQTELNANAMSVPTSITTLGHLGLSMHPTAYADKSTTPLPNPANPGSGPDISRNSTAPIIQQAHFDYKVEKATYDTYHAADRALKTQVIKAVPDIFYDELHDEDIGYAAITTRDLLDHLWDTYGQIDDDQLASNIQKMNTPWLPPTPIDRLFTQIKNCRKFSSDGNEPITESNGIRTGVLIIE